MGLGELLALPIRVLNIPARAIELLVAGTNPDDEDNLLSKPLKKLAEAIEELDD